MMDFVCKMMNLQVLTQRIEHFKTLSPASKNDDFALKTRNFASKPRNCVSKKRNFAFKMMTFTGLDGDEPLADGGCHVRARE